MSHVSEEVLHTWRSSIGKDWIDSYAAETLDLVTATIENILCSPSIYINRTYLATYELVYYLQAWRESVGTLLFPVIDMIGSFLTCPCSDTTLHVYARKDVMDECDR